MKTYQFQVPGEPKGQPRPRAFVRNGHASVYNPSTAEGWKSLIAAAAKEAGLAGAMLQGPIGFEMYCSFSRPSSHYGTGRNAGTIKNSAPGLHHTGLPDLDNIEKAALDCLTQVCAWRNDSQICRKVSHKRWNSTNHTHFVIYEMSPAREFPEIEGEQTKLYLTTQESA